MIYRLQELLVTATTVRIDFLQRFEFATKPIEKKVAQARTYLLPYDQSIFNSTCSSICTL